MCNCVCAEFNVVCSIAKITGVTLCATLAHELLQSRIEISDRCISVDFKAGVVLVSGDLVFFFKLADSVNNRHRPHAILVAFVLAVCPRDRRVGIDYYVHKVVFGSGGVESNVHFSVCIGRLGSHVEEIGAC